MKLLLNICTLAIVLGVSSANWASAYSTKNVNQDVEVINNSIQELLGELGAIKREAQGRLSSVKQLSGLAQGEAEPERIRMTKVSRFVLKRVLELETESLGMRDELAKLIKLSGSQASNNEAKLDARSEQLVKQEDIDFDFDTTTTTTSSRPSSTMISSSSTKKQSSTSTTPTGMPATTLAPEEESAKIGFDVDALKRLGEEIGKRLDLFGKEAAKNLADLIDGVKLVFREPTNNKNSTRPNP